MLSTKTALGGGGTFFYSSIYACSALYNSIYKVEKNNAFHVHLTIYLIWKTCINIFSNASYRIQLGFCLFIMKVYIYNDTKNSF